MATVCTNCGHDLPRDDAHFCTQCGTLVPSHPFSAQSLSTAATTSNQTGREDADKPVVREQMAYRQTEKPPLREQRVQQPRQRTTKRIAPDNTSASPEAPVSWPAPITHVSVKETPAQKESEQEVLQEQSPVQRPRIAPERELHVKVWNQDNPPTPLPESRVEPERDIEDAPTSPLELSDHPEKEHVLSETKSEPSGNDIEYLDTTPLPNYVQPQSVQSPEQVPHALLPIFNDTPVSTLPSESRQQRPQNPSTPIPDVDKPQQAPVSPSLHYATAQRSHDGFSPPKQERRAPVAPNASVSRSQKSPIPFVILLALLGMLVLGGGAWVLQAQPFSVSPVTQPLQDFHDTGLGIAMSYPNSWTVQHTADSVLFADSSHTGQVKVQVANTASDAATYMQQQAKKSGMTAIKPLGTTSFAGLAWQQIGGNVQQDGANYTTTMLATMHGNRMYLLTQMAPQNVYADEERVVFSAMRSSFKFL